MDGTRFDDIARAMTAGASRRRMVGGLLGGAAALLTGAAALEAKKGGNGKGKAKGKGKGKGKGKTKVWLCHQPDPITGAGTILQVAGPAAKGHTKHGDALCPELVDTTQHYVNGGTCTVTAGVAACDPTPVTG